MIVELSADAERGELGIEPSAEPRKHGTARGAWRRWRADGGVLRRWNWVQLLWAAGTLLVSIGGGLVGAGLLGGAFGVTIGLAWSAVIQAAVTIFCMRRTPVRGLFSARLVDVCWAILLGGSLPFIAGGLLGLSGATNGWPALESISPRWLLAGVVLPVVTAILQQLFLSGLVLIAVYGFVRRLAAPIVAQLAGVSVAAAAGVILAIVFSGNVLGLPLLTPSLIALVGVVFTMCTGRIWGSLWLAGTAYLVWALLCVAGTILA